MAFPSPLVAAENRIRHRRPQTIQPNGTSPIAQSWPRKLVVKTMANENEQDGPVGYGRPPLATRFKAGHSGNPSGRPKKVRSLKDELLDELNERIRIHEGDGEVEISKARAIAKALLHAAVGGNMRALSVLVSFCARNSGDTNETQDQLAAPEDTEIFDDYIDRELRRRTSACDANVNNSPTDSHENKGEDNAK
jgi:hypothetical protein